MPAPSTSQAALRSAIERLSRSPRTVLADPARVGCEAIDRALGGGLARARLHEVIANEAEDAASAAGFAAMCARLIGGPLAWLCVGRSDLAPHPHGLGEIGLDPRRFLSVSAPDPPSLLRAADEAMRCRALGAVVIELWREPRRIDLTASRRLMLAAEASGVTALLLRIAVQPVPNAAQTRWSVTAAPSRPLPGGGPGAPAFDIDLLRQRGGPAGMRWRVEWDRDQACFRAPLPGALAAVPPRRPLADDPAGLRHTG